MRAKSTNIVEQFHLNKVRPWHPHRRSFGDRVVMRVAMIYFSVLEAYYTANIVSCEFIVSMSIPLCCLWKRSRRGYTFILGAVR